MQTHTYKYTYKDEPAEHNRLACLRAYGVYVVELQRIYNLLVTISCEHKRVCRKDHLRTHIRDILGTYSDMLGTYTSMFAVWTICGWSGKDTAMDTSTEHRQERIAGEI